MGFDAPMQLAWAAAVIVVVLLYIRWAARKRRPTTTLPIWENAFARRSWWSRWRRTVSILAACVPIVLIAVALAQPYFSPARGQSRAIVLVIDNTASMNAQPHGRSRLEDAKRQARRLVRNLRTHDRMAILSADSAVRVRCGLTDDRTALHLGLDEVQPTDGAGAMPDAIATARRLVASEPRPVVVVISDAAFAAAGNLMSDEIAWNRVAGNADSAANWAITRVAARPSRNDSTVQNILVEVANYGAQTAAAEVELQVVDQSRRLEFNIPGKASVQRIAKLPLREPGLLTFRLAIEDALAADNTASLLLKPGQPVRVILITGRDDSPVETVLKGLPGVEFTRASAPPENVAENTLLIFEGIVPKTLPSAPSLVFGPQSSTTLWKVGPAQAAPQAAAAAEQPLVAGVDLRDVIINEAVKLQFESPANTLVESTGGAPLIAVIPRESGDVAVVSFAPRDSDLPWHDDFPKLIANAVNWLTRSDRAPRQWTTDNAVVLPQSMAAQQIVSPYGEAHANGANLVDVGLWQLRNDADDVTAILPVNLSNSEESDLRARTASRQKTWPHISWWPDTGPLWTPLTALALIWIAGHWAFYQRRSID